MGVVSIDMESERDATKFFEVAVCCFPGQFYARRGVFEYEFESSLMGYEFEYEFG